MNILQPPTINNSQLSSFILLNGLIVYNLSDKHFYSGDGITSGGIRLATKLLLFSGDYNDLDNKPNILQGIKEVSALNEEGFIEVDKYTIPTILKTNKGNLYPILKGTLLDNNDKFLIDPTAYLNYDNTPSFSGIWTIYCTASAFKLNLNKILLGPCTSLGFVEGELPGFGWTDPNDLLVGGGILGTWNRTVLVRKLNSYPLSPSDGITLATTSKALANKNYYRDHTFFDSTTLSGVTYKYKLFSESIDGFWNCLTANEFTNGTGLSWTQVQQYVRDGRGAELFPVGTIFEVKHGDFQHTDGSGLYFRVVGHDQVPAADESITHTMCLECTECIVQLPFDPLELQYAITEDENYKSGVSYYEYISGTTYNLLSAGINYNVGDPIPLAEIYLQNLYSRYTTSYYKNGGNNDWPQSNVRQWLNSNKLGGTWFTKQNIWDICSEAARVRNGFCYSLDSDFLNALIIAKNYYTDDVVSTTKYSNDIFFLLDKDQLTESTDRKLQYYLNGGDTKKCLINGTTSIVYFTRTAQHTSGDYVYGSYSAVYLINASGNLEGFDYNNTKNAAAWRTWGICPACIIG